MPKRRELNDEFKRETVRVTRQPDANESWIPRDTGVGDGVPGRGRRELETNKAHWCPGPIT